MNFFEDVKLALNGLRTNKMRALLTMLGIIIGISAVIAIMTIGDYMRSTMLNTLSDLGGGNINIYVSGKDYNVVGTPTDDEQLSLEKIEKFRERFANDLIGIELTDSGGSGKIKNATPAVDVTISGINSEFFNVEKAEIVQGRAISNRDVLNERSVVILPVNVATSIYGESDPIGKDIMLETKNGSQYFTIIGIYKQPSSVDQQNASIASNSDYTVNPTIYVPYSTARTLVGSTNKNFTSMTVKVKTGVDATNTAKSMAEYLNKLMPANSNYKVSAQSMESIMSSMNSMMNQISVAISVVAGISLLVGGIGVMNIMLVSVTERTSEIGIRKALGATNGAIRTQFIIESIIICIIGGVIGIIIGTLMGALGAQLMATLSGSAPPGFVVPSLNAILIAVGFSTFIGVFFGYYPANKAAKLNPIDALRYE